MNSFNKKSQEKVDTCVIELQLFLNEVIKDCPIPFSISCGHRTIKEQQELYKQGRTKAGKIVTQIDGIKTLSKHNYFPSEAFDIFINIKGKEWDLTLIKAVASHILLSAKKHSINIEWGGNWKKFKDYPHFQIIR